MRNADRKLAFFGWPGVLLLYADVALYEGVFRFGL